MSERQTHIFTSQGINHVNQDIGGFNGNVLWVLDGATPLFGDDLLGGNDVQKTMKLINHHLKNHYDHESSFADNLIHVCKKIQEYYRHTISEYDSIPAYQLPTFACAAVEINGSQLNYFVIGDCEIRYGQCGWIHDEDFLHVNLRNKEDEKRAVEEYKENHPDFLNEEDRKELHQKILEQCKWQRSCLNTQEEGGYWIGSLDGKGIPHGKHGMVSIHENDPVYVYCDGMAHLIEKEPSVLKSQSLPEAIHAIRHFTEDDVTIVWSIAA